MARSSRGPKRPTISDVARRAGVSKSLVSLVMAGSGPVSTARREAVLRAANELGYRPNAIARSLVQRRSRVIGVVASDLDNPFFADVYTGIRRAGAAAGYRTLLNTGDRQRREEQRAVETLLELQVDGLVLAGTILTRAAILEAARDVPVVVVARSLRAAGVDCVTNDDGGGAEAVVEHCAALGHCAISHIDGGPGAGASIRRRGYQRAMKRLGLAASIQVVRGAYTEEGGYRGAQELLASRQRPTAIFAANDLAAIGALNAIEEHELSVPDDISLVGYDNTSLAALRHISLTTVHQPRIEMGEMAARALLERIDEGRTQPRHVLLPPSLVARGTTAPPAKVTKRVRIAR